MFQLIYHIFLLSFVLNYNENVILSVENTKTEIIQCGSSKTITIQLPEGYSDRFFSYEEGVMKTFTYLDSSYVLIFCGLMQSFPILKECDYQIRLRRKGNLVKSCSGVNLQTTKYWREDNYKSGIAVVYDNVPKEMQETFNNALESVVIQNKSKGS